MKNAIIVILTLCLGVSLWITRQDRKEMRQEIRKLQAAAEAARAAAPDAADGKTTADNAARGMMPKAPPSIDFSGTGFEDDSWKLDNKAKATAPAMGLPSATLNDRESPAGSIPDDSGSSGAAPQKKASPFKSILTNPGN